MSTSKIQDSIQKLKNHNKDLGIFPNLETIGSYDDFSQIVFLDYLDEQSFSELIKIFKSSTESYRKGEISTLQENHESIIKFGSTCVHEFTHWLDHTSTLWGQRQLILIYNAINAWTNQDEQEFYRIVIANSERYRARLATYYTENYKIEQERSVGIEPWGYEYSCGIEFGADGKPRVDRPFVCTVFSNSSKQRIVRVPFSMFALTEANATYAEFKLKAQGIGLLDHDSRLVQQKIWTQEVMQNLYNPNLVIYSVATHCLANSIKTNDVLQAYEFSSALATLCLNLPKDLYHLLTVPNEFKIWGNRVQALQEIADPGFAFFTIARQAPKFQSEMSVGQWLEESVKNAGLPNLETINDLVAVEMKKLEDEVIQGKYTQKLLSLLATGRQNFECRGVWGENVLSMETLNQDLMYLPPIVLGDQYTVSVASKTIPISPKEMEEWIDQIVNIEVSIGQFIRSCRF